MVLHCFVSGFCGLQSVTNQTDNMNKHLTVEVNESYHQKINMLMFGLLHRGERLCIEFMRHMFKPSTQHEMRIVRTSGVM